MAAVIRATGLGKRYRLGRRQSYQVLRERLAAIFARREPEPGEFWALKDLDFSVEAGEVLGVIGRNGAGKSTLLKILARVTAPTAGEVEIHGRLGSLLEVGIGFHPELDGRENVFLSGAMLGMRRAEVARKFDAIVDFAEVGGFLDTPVKRYSSGMYLRLAFAVAAHLDSEVLLIDEALAVGDAAFQAKCLARIGEVARGGRTVIFVSHNLAAVTRLCTRALLLGGGRALFTGTPAEAVERHLAASLTAAQGVADLLAAPGREPGAAPLLVAASSHADDGSGCQLFATGGTLRLRVAFRLERPLASAYLQINVCEPGGQRVMTLCTLHDGGPLALAAGAGSVECAIADLRLASGDYLLSFEIGTASPVRQWLDHVVDALRIHVQLGDYLGGGDLQREQGLLAQRSQWRQVG